MHISSIYQIKTGLLLWVLPGHLLFLCTVRKRHTAQTRTLISASLGALSATLSPCLSSAPIPAWQKRARQGSTAGAYISISCASEAPISLLLVCPAPAYPAQKVIWLQSVDWGREKRRGYMATKGKEKYDFLSFKLVNGKT